MDYEWQARFRRAVLGTGLIYPALARALQTQEGYVRSWFNGYSQPCELRRAEVLHVLMGRAR